MKRFALGFFVLTSYLAQGQNVQSFGVFGGFNVPITIDKGLDKDVRFTGKFSIRGTPVGFHYGYDRPGFGWVISPSYLIIGQKFIVNNSTGGDVGTRDISMSYFSLPITLKFHVNDISFFRFSMIAAADFCMLMDAQETLTHEAAKLRFPSGVSVPTDPGYTISYDGVFVPQVTDKIIVSKDKFNSFQIFGAVGVRADFDIGEDWSVMADGRANFGLFDSRKQDYLNTLQEPSGAADINGKPGAPDLYGQRRDVFFSFSFGISRIIQSKPKFKSRKSAPIPKMSMPHIDHNKKKK